MRDGGKRRQHKMRTYDLLRSLSLTSASPVRGDPAKTVEWETNQVARAAAAVAEWNQKHPVQSLALRTGLKKPPADLQRLEQTHAETVRFLEGSQRRLAELEQAWSKKRLAYQQQLEREGEEIRKAKRCLGVIDTHSEHFRQFWERQAHGRIHRQQERRSHDRNRVVGAVKRKPGNLLTSTRRSTLALSLELVRGYDVV